VIARDQVIGKEQNLTTDAHESGAESKRFVGQDDKVFVGPETAAEQIPRVLFGC